MFLTLTCASYGPVRGDGTPADPDTYDYQRAGRDAIHFPALFDRLIQNLGRFVGYGLQYFATIEPQRRLAPHAPSPPAAPSPAKTCAASWPPPTTRSGGPAQMLSVSTASTCPSGTRHPAATSTPPPASCSPTWDEALDAIGPADQPLHVARFGAKFDARGVLANSRDSARCIGYLTKYLVKDVATCHIPETGAQREHVERLVDALRYEPCSPTCANWLRYGITPKHPRKGLGKSSSTVQGWPSSGPIFRGCPSVAGVVRRDGSSIGSRHTERHSTVCHLVKVRPMG
jgi:hypothetical protein